MKGQRMKRRILLCVSVCLALSGFASAQKRAFTVEDLYRIKSISDVHISPDGKAVTYVVTNSDLPRAKRESHIWLMDIDGRNVRQLTNSAKGESAPRFSPDGKSLLFISSRDGSANLYLIPLAGGE